MESDREKMIQALREEMQKVYEVIEKGNYWRLKVLARALHYAAYEDWLSFRYSFTIGATGDVRVNIYYDDLNIASVSLPRDIALENFYTALGEKTWSIVVQVFRSFARELYERSDIFNLAAKIEALERRLASLEEAEEE